MSDDVEGSDVSASAPSQNSSDSRRSQSPSLGRILLSGPALAVLSVALFGLAGEAVPALEPVRLFSAPSSEPETSEKAPDAPPVLDVGEAELSGESRNLPGMATPETLSQVKARGPIGGQEAPLDLPAIEAEDPPVELLDPTGTALDHFYASLAETAQKKKGSRTRIAHFGDSIVVSDYVSGTLRRKLQDTFGDAGHGYMLIANPWPAYFHNDVFRFATKGFRVSRIVGPLTSDNRYGLGGVTFRATAGAIAQFGTAEKGNYGRKVSRFELSYLSRPNGGKFDIWVDGKVHTEVDTKNETETVLRATIEVPDGEHRFEMRMRGGETRSFGVTLERDEPGVVLDALGVQGARIRFLDKNDDEHFAEELKWRAPNLLVYQFGANESGDGYAYPMDEYLRTMKLVIAQGQKALPEASCLIIGAMDRARRRDGVTSSMKIIQLIVAEQEKAAKELGCAYFDTYAAMGGWGSMPAWVRRGLGQADMTHPTGVGAIRIGNWIYRALMKGYDDYLAKRSGK